MLKYLMLKDQDAAGFQKLEIVLYWFIVAFFLTMFMAGSPVLNNIVIGGLFIYSFFFNTWKEKLNLLTKRREIWLMLGFFLVHTVSLLWSENKSEATVMLGMRIPLLLFPLSLGLITIRQEVLARILMAFSAIVTVIALFCFLVAFNNYRVKGDTGLLYNDSLTVILHIQSIYVAMLVNIAFFSIAWLMSASKLPDSTRAWLYFSLIILLPFHFMLASRMAIIVLYGAAGIFLTYRIITRRLLLEGATLLMAILVGAFLLLKFSPKTFNRFRELTHTKYDIRSEAKESHYNMELKEEQWNGANIRLAVWDCGIEAGKATWLAGTGLGDKMDVMMEVYRQKGFVFGYKTKRNLHNNYLDVWITFGIIGLVLFLSAWLLLPLIGTIRAVNYWGLTVIVAFAFSYFSETYFDRSLGNVLTGFFICLVVATGTRKQATTG